MSALLDDIINLASDGKQPLPDILRKCLFLAHELKNDRLKAWANQELNGYKSGKDLPEYRAAEPWMSEEDIEKGSRGLDDIGKALATMGVGIICLTPENLEKPWILFEAGALSKALGDKTRVCPFLFGDLRTENVKLPLGMFQATRAVKDETCKLVGTVNRVLGGPLGEDKLDTVFERMWPELEKRLDSVPKTAAAVAPLRSEREMVAEPLELSRGAAANIAWSKEALTTLLKRTNRFTAQAGLTGEVGRFDLRTTLSDRIEAGERALAESKAALAAFETGTRPVPTYEELKQRVRELEERGKRKRTMR